MTWFPFRLLVAFFAVGFGQAVSGQDLRPTDPIASIDGYPVFMGELNLLLMKKLGARDPMDVSGDVRRASASLIARQHLAMRSLRTQGGRSLQSILEKDWAAFTAELKRAGLSPSDYAKRYQSDEVSLRAARDWESAWKTYLKSRVTESNLKRLFESSPERYAGSRWDVSHLFLPIDRSEPHSKEIAIQTAERLAKQFDAEDKESLAGRFAELAREQSAGATASEGGRIGWVSKSGDLPGLVMAAIRKTEENSVTRPVVTSIGVHLVLVHKRSSKDVAFEELADRSELRRDAANKLFTALTGAQTSKVTWLIESLRPPN